MKVHTLVLTLVVGILYVVKPIEAAKDILVDVIDSKTNNTLTDSTIHVTCHPDMIGDVPIEATPPSTTIVGETSFVCKDVSLSDADDEVVLVVTVEHADYETTSKKIIIDNNVELEQHTSIVIIGLLEEPQKPEESQESFAAASESTPARVLVAPANDDCANAISLTTGSLTSGSTTEATDDPDARGVGTCDVDVSNPSSGVWYSVLVPVGVDGNTPLKASTCEDDSNGSSDYDSQMTVFRGGCDNLVCVGGNLDGPGCLFGGSTVEWCADDGVEYLIYVHGFSANTGDFVLDVTSLDIPVPDNNDVASAINLPFDTPTDFSLRCGVVEDGEPTPGPGTESDSCDSQDGWCSFETAVQNSIWYTFNPNQAKCVNIIAPALDTQLALWKAEDPLNFTTYVEVAANDDSGVDLSAAILNACTVDDDDDGATYMIQLDGHGGAFGTGTITLTEGGNCIACCNPPEQGIIESICLAEGGEDYICLGFDDFLPASSDCDLDIDIDIQDISLTIYDDVGATTTVLDIQETIANVTGNEIFAENCSASDSSNAQYDNDDDIICFKTDVNSLVGKKESWSDSTYEIDYTATDTFNQTSSFKRTLTVPRYGKKSTFDDEGCIQAIHKCGKKASSAKGGRRQYRRYLQDAADGATADEDGAHEREAEEEI